MAHIMIYIVSARKVPWVSMQRAAAGKTRVQGGGGGGEQASVPVYE